jgi:hypothetical protein
MNLGFYRASISVGLLAALACSSNNGSTRNTATTGHGGSGPVIGLGGSVGTTGGSGSGISVGGGNGAIIGGGGELVVPEDDPTNPNLTHPKCGKAGCADFPEAPILGDGVPANAPMLFGAPTNMTSGSLCVLEPQLSAGATPGAMLPANWVRPRFKFAATGLDLFEIRIHNAAQKFDLVAYTKKTTWYLPKDIWAGTDTAIAAGNGAANNGAGAPFTVTVRGVNSASPGTPVGVVGDFNVAPVVATGSMVFWTVNSAQVTPDSSQLLGFAVGDEGVAQSLSLQTVKWTGQVGEDGAVLRGFYDDPKLPKFVDGQVRCIGCHSSTPDGTSVVFTDDWPWNKSAAQITMGNIGAIPTTITAGARSLMKQPWLGTQSMSKAHWQAGDRVLITSYGMYTSAGKMRDKPYFALNYDSTPEERIKSHQLAWIDMESTAAIDDAVLGYGDPQTKLNAAITAAKGTGWNIIATGDDVTKVSDVSPSISHTGDKIAYVATDYSPDGHPDYTAKTADLKVVPFNANRTGGASTAVAGAADPAYLEYYPSFSADDKFLAFTRAPTPNGSSAPDGPYYNRFGEIMIIPAAGGTATRLAANDPVACGGDVVSQGLINSWPKWSPDAVSAHGKTYYFVIFSSARKYGDEFSQQFQLPTSTASAFKGVNSSSQLYLAAIVIDNASGAITSYPAQYIWNQNRLATASGDGMATKFSNLTPAWDPFQLPPIVINQVPEDVPR